MKKELKQKSLQKHVDGGFCALFADILAFLACECLIEFRCGVRIYGFITRKVSANKDVSRK